jgi:heat shock protein HslJ
MMRTAAAAAGLLLVLTACSEASLSVEGPAAALIDSTWLLVEGEGPEGSVEPNREARVTLRFEPGGDGFAGVAACNEYGGRATVRGDAVAIGELGHTDMACEPAVMTVEQRYLAALQRADTLTVSDHILELTGRGARLVFERQPDAPTADLLDTTWRLESLITGDGEDAVLTQAQDPAELVMEDGTLSLVTSCVEVDAEWVEQGAEYRITAATYDYADPDADCLREDAEQQHILEVFDGAFTAEVDGDVVTLLATRSSTGLQFGNAR